MKGNKILIILGLLFLIAMLNQPKPQTVVPDITREGCFEKNDCYRPIKEGYCDVKFDCVVGKCHYEDVLCPEDCGVIGDEDMDGDSDCDDTDCWDDPHCPCYAVSFGECKTGRCWCPQGMSPRWVVEEDNHWCQCI